MITLIILSLVACWSFFKKGYFESHDGEWMAIRFTAFHQALSSGQFPVRFTDRLNNNYGYPVFNFLYPLPFYIAEVSKLAGAAGAITYLFIPYRFVDLYVRGSLGESVAFAFVPLILGSIFKIQK